jgi:hypothetical protein
VISTGYAETFRMKVEERKPQAVKWYRSPLAPQDLKRLHERSDVRGLLQALGFLGLLAATKRATSCIAATRSILQTTSK